MSGCCNEAGCRRKKPIKLMRDDITGTWFYVTDYTKAKLGEDTWRATTKHAADPAQAVQLEAMRDALGVIMALACGRLWRAQRLLDRVLGIEPERPPEPNVRPNPAIRIVREER